MKNFIVYLKIDLEISKHNNFNILKELDFVEECYNKYFDFIDKLMKMMDDNQLKTDSVGIKTNITTKVIEPIEEIKKLEDEDSKKKKLKELFELGIINLQSIREAYEEVLKNNINN